MGSGGVAIAALPTVICLKVSFSDGLGGGNFVETQQLVAIELILPLAAVQLRLQLRLQLSETVENADYFGLDGKWGKGNSIVSDN